MQGQDWVGRAGELFEAAMFGGDASALERSDDVLDAVPHPPHPAAPASAAARRFRTRSSRRALPPPPSRP